jgi:hypothetical protein
MNIKQTVDFYNTNPESIPSTAEIKEMVLAQKKYCKNFIAKWIYNIQLAWIESIEKDVCRIKEEIAEKKVLMQNLPPQSLSQRLATIERVKKENPDMLRIFSDLTEEEQSVLIDWEAYCND